MQASTDVVEGKAFCKAKFFVHNYTAIFSGVQYSGRFRSPVPIPLTEGCVLRSIQIEEDTQAEGTQYYSCLCKTALCNSPMTVAQFIKNNFTLPAPLIPAKDGLL
ncbi:Protein CBG24687 [Caenorhabditis briggsae]|nr:Protein CBG24687 [Caenorhabditis briggsae]CAP21237.1 Protein CBG24687 [Caenorhabditis briggsae]